MILFLILVAVIWFISKKNRKIRFWKNKIIQPPFNYYLLIGMLIIGFFFRLDYSDRFGCIVFKEPVFELRNILFSAISITLVLLSFFAKKRTIKLTFISFELVFWLYKFFLFKGGYVVGAIATADPLISLYDTTTLALRLFIINSLLKVSINQIYPLICTIIIISVKIYIFPLPFSFYVEVRKSELEGEITKNFLTKGEWVENKDTTEKTRIVFLPENVAFYNFQNNDTLSFNQIFWTKECVHLESWDRYKNHVCIFEFQENGKDTLNVNIIYNGEDHKTQMIKEIAPVFDTRLEEMIVKTIRAYQSKDEAELNKLIFKDFGITFLYRRGAHDNISVSDKISFDNPVPEYLPFAYNITTDYNIHFEKLPEYNCNNEKWSKPSGIYCDAINRDKTLSTIAKNENEYLNAGFSAATIKKFEDIESASHKIIVIGKEFGEFIFYLTFIENEWYLTIIDRFEACSA